MMPQRSIIESRYDAIELIPGGRVSTSLTKFLGDVVLGGREISEIVYWLWKRDGKAGKYPELCKRHPELFEPISGLADFKTEIGRMLVERSKQ